MKTTLLLILASSSLVLVSSPANAQEKMISQKTISLMENYSFKG